METVRTNLKRHLEIPEETGIILTTSETDAQFIPLLITKALNRDKKEFLNIVTGNGEISKSILTAAGGKRISELD